MVNSPLIRPYLFGWVALGRVPYINSHDCGPHHAYLGCRRQRPSYGRPSSWKAPNKNSEAKRPKTANFWLVCFELPGYHRLVQIDGVYINVQCICLKYIVYIYV